MPDKEYPVDWLTLELRANKLIGDWLIADKKYLGVKVRSAVNTHDYNYLLNPLFPGYHDLVKVASVEPVPFDHRLLKGEK